MTSPLQQKIKIAGPSVVTANRATDGVVIYRTASHDWSDAITDAAVVENADDARALLAEAVQDDLHAIGAYIAPVVVVGGSKIEAGNLRERIRAEGVTVPLVSVRS